MPTSNHSVSRRRRHRSRRSSRSRRRMAYFSALIAVLLFGFAFWAYRYAENENTPAKDWYEASASQKQLVELPKDDASHETGMERWRYNGHLRTPEGHVFSYHYVMFVVDGVVKNMVSHLSFTDHQTGKRYHYQRSMNAPKGPEDGQGFDFTAGTWEMARETGKDRLKADAPEFALALTLEDAAPPVIHGTSGLLDVREAGKSYYYSRTRMKTMGELIYAGKKHPVSGQAWFDHQWGHFKTSLLQYDWIALTLRDGIEVMLYQISDPGGKQAINTGTFIQNGQAEELKEEDFTARPSLAWASPGTGIRYPIKWQVQIPQKQVDVVITPVIEGGEFDSRTTTYDAYWEGAVRATGSHPGVGFLEVARKK